ncbi:fimbrial protein [Hafnia paralvei]|uniref:fimbrial protein n=1 Tax=Hafnia paralvei TaxID=546367 RepID=UPI000DF20EA7|nr:fimbrial protein [Hafnia paralvei]RDA61920.1 fimbrial protein [Hafnia paralvei]RDA62980.1 fimbrial protein [Hafnia paralvei]RDA63820.1 fimbrial protein [Hafnia paralvei]RDA75106.1 fimbrial protein [Hafnia paralvei]RDA75511.1 fimbrial protein [Hafnia paralvei]
MLRIIMLIFVLSGGYFTAFSAKAEDLGCRFEDGSNTTILSVPQMEIAANTPDGTVLYTSPKITKKLTCYPKRTVSNNIVYGTITGDYRQLSAQLKGLRISLHLNQYSFNDTSGGIIIGRTFPVNGREQYSEDVSIWYDVTVDSSRGKVPVSGTDLSGTIRALNISLSSITPYPMAYIDLKIPQITYIPCAMKLSISPDTINFGLIKNGDLENGVKLQRKFSTSIQKSAGCSAYGAVPFHINMYFEPTNSVINTDGSLSLNNGLGLTISDTTGKNITYNTAWKINDVTGDLGIKNYFTANLQKVSGQDIKTGSFSADVVVRIDYS